MRKVILLSPSGPRRPYLPTGLSIIIEFVSPGGLRKPQAKSGILPQASGVRWSVVQPKIIHVHSHPAILFVFVVHTPKQCVICSKKGTNPNQPAGNRPYEKSAQVPVFSPTKVPVSSVKRIGRITEPIACNQPASAQIHGKAPEVEIGPKASTQEIAQGHGAKQLQNVVLALGGGRLKLTGVDVMHTRILEFKKKSEYLSGQTHPGPCASGNLFSRSKLAFSEGVG